MKKLVKYTSLVLLFVLALSTVCFASDINMNLQANTITSTLVNSTDGTNLTSTGVNSLNGNQSSILETTPLATSYTTVSGSSTVQDDGLTITNIINIFVVVVGIVLILLGLAILIRLKY